MKKGGACLEICETSGLVRALSTFKKSLGDIAGAARGANFDRA